MAILVTKCTLKLKHIGIASHADAQHSGNCSVFKPTWSAGALYVNYNSQQPASNGTPTS